MTAKRKPRARRLELGTALAIGEAAALKKRLTALLGRKSPITVQGGELQRLDSASMQLLAAFWRDARDKEISVDWATISESARRSIALVGMNDVLGVRPE